MKKRLISAFIAACMLFTMLFSQVTASAAYTRGWGYGETYKSITADDVISLSSAQKTASGVQIDAGGSAVYGFYVQYGVSGVTFVYENASGTVTIDMGERQYTTEKLSGSGEYYLNFGDYLGLKDQFYDYNKIGGDGYYRDYLEPRGEYEVKVTSEGGITLKEMKLERELIPEPPARDIVDISDEARKTLSTVIMEVNSPVISVNGATRYINNDDVTEVPLKHNGKIYLPINTVAKALEYYHEDYPDKDYILMRGEVNEVVYLEGRTTLTKGLLDPVTLNEEVFVRHNGKTYAQVRYFAELAGDTVGYKDGLVVIDNKYTVKDVFEDEALKAYAQSFFAPYKAKRVEGTTYYVAQKHPNASDSNAGTYDAPFKTISKAAEVAMAGDTVIVKEGVYREELKPQNDGTAVSPITFKAAEGEKVVISALEELKGWGRLGDTDTYIAPMPWDLGVTRNQIFIDGKPLNEARYPNGPEVLYDTERLDNTWPVRGDLWKPNDTYTVKSSTLLWQEEDDYWKGGIYVGAFGYLYSFQTAKIASSTKGTLTLDSAELGGPAFAWPYDSKGLDHGYIVGHMNCLDIPGEWIHEAGNLYMIFPEGATPNETVVEAKKRQRVIDLNDKKYINIVGFETIGGGARTDEAAMCMLNGLNMKYISHFIHAAQAYKGVIDFPYVAEDKDTSLERGENGVFLRGTNDIVVNCHIDHSAGAGLMMFGLYGYVENNIMNDCGYNAMQNSGIYISARPYESFTKPRGGHSIYNNTIYNMGRSAMQVASPDKSGFSYMSYLPMETAYNDFHGANLDSTDTGVTYEYTVTLDLDGYDSRLHHNYMYYDVDAEDKPAQFCMIYHDNGARGHSSYNNQTFTDNSDVVPTYAGFNYEQRASSSESYSRMWNNSEHYVPGGVDGLSEGYFSEEKPFYAGAMKDYRTLEDVDYTLNYDRYKAGIYNMTYRAMDAELSEGVTIDPENGYAKFSGNGQYIHFKDVVFPENSETFVINFHGNSHWTQDDIEIIIGDSMENGTRYIQTIEANSYDPDDVERVAYTISKTSGTHDVWIKVTDYKSLEIGGIGVYDIPDVVMEDPAYSAFKWAGEYDVNEKFDTNATGSPDVIYLAGEAFGKKLLGSTYPGSYIKYEDIAFKNPSDTFVMNAGSGGKYGNQLFNIYVEPADSETYGTNLVASYHEDSVNWEKNNQFIELEKEIPAGTYDVYIELAVEGEDEEAKQAYRKAKQGTVVYWGFISTGDVLREYKEVRSKKYAGEFDPALSVQNKEFPFHVTCLEWPEIDTTSGLTYTLPGTRAGYSGFKIEQDSTVLKIKYSAEADYDGQTVEIRVGSPDSEPIASFVTEGKGYRYMTTKEFKLDKVIPAGTYDVYLTFVDDGEGIKTTNVSWFGFN